MGRRQQKIDHAHIRAERKARKAIAQRLTQELGPHVRATASGYWVIGVYCSNTAEVRQQVRRARYLAEQRSTMPLISTTRPLRYRGEDYSRAGASLAALRGGASQRVVLWTCA